MAEETSRIAYHYLLDASLALVLGTAINIIMNHLALVREISKLPFQNIYNSASELEPIIWVSMVSVTVWFAGISVVVLWTETGISSAVGLTILAFLVFVGVIFILAPQLRLHSALLDAKRDLIADIQKRYQEIDQSTQTETGPSEDLSLRLEVTDRRLENAKSIRTWVYDISSASKLVAASILPWLNLVNGILKFPLFD